MSNVVSVEKWSDLLKKDALTGNGEVRESILLANYNENKKVVEELAREGRLANYNNAPQLKKVEETRTGNLDNIETAFHQITQFFEYEENLVVPAKPSPPALIPLSRINKAYVANVLKEKGSLRIIPKFGEASFNTIAIFVAGVIGLLYASQYVLLVIIWVLIGISSLFTGSVLGVFNSGNGMLVLYLGVVLYFLLIWGVYRLWKSKKVKAAMPEEIEKIRLLNEQKEAEYRAKVAEREAVIQRIKERDKMRELKNKIRGISDEWQEQS